MYEDVKVLNNLVVHLPITMSLPIFLQFKEKASKVQQVIYSFNRKHKQFYNFITSLCIKSYQWL